MSEHNPAARAAIDAQARHVQQVTTALTQAQGWNEVFLPKIMQQIAAYERVEGNATLDATLRLDAVARKHELLGLVAWVYQQAQLPSPFETQRLGLYMLTTPQREGTVPPPPDAAPPPSLRTPRPVRRHAGSVA